MTHENLDGTEFSPKVFKSIKKKLHPDRDFYVRDRSTVSGWKIATKRFQKHYDALAKTKEVM